MLRLPVKINGVNNLSDARYCAGMGVDMIGFSISNKHTRYLPSDKINGITGWVAGVKIVAEGYLGEDMALLSAEGVIIHAGAIEIDAIMYRKLDINPKPVIYRFKIHEWANLHGNFSQDDLLHLVLQEEDILEADFIQDICSKNQVLINVSHLELAQIEKLLIQTKPFGISLDGGNELSPGVKDFEHLAEVLEYLEV